MNRKPSEHQRRAHDSRTRPRAAWRERLHEIIFEADTVLGKAFDLALFLAIGLSIAVVMLESVNGIPQQWLDVLRGTEWILTILFTLEYILRLVCVDRPLHYVFSFFGIIDLLAILPTYLAALPMVDSRSSSLVVIRSFRLLRVFRVLKLAQYLTEARTLMVSLHRTRAKITVFFTFMLIVVLMMGATMYVLEGGGTQEQPTSITSIPAGVYWAIVTVTTVGYGDVVPRTLAGKALSALAMIVGYSIIVVPTGIVTADVISASQGGITTQACPRCSREGHTGDAKFCKYCGALL